MTFEGSDDGPALREDVAAGEMVIFNDDMAVQHHRTALSYDLGFSNPRWKRLTRRQMETLTGEPLPKKRVEVQVEEANLGNSPTMRWLSEHFPEQ